MQSFPGKNQKDSLFFCASYREGERENLPFQSKYRKDGFVGFYAEKCVDKCPPQEYNSELLLTKHEYYSLGGCIYE